MFSSCTLNLIKPGSKTLEHRARRLGPFPMARWMKGRRRAYKSRFLDTGPWWSRVWLAVKPGLRAKRHWKMKEPTGSRMLWRPIERGYQRLYVGDIMRYDIKKHLPRKRLRAPNTEIGKVRHDADGYHFKGTTRFGPGPYYPRGFDEDFRVF